MLKKIKTVILAVALVLAVLPLAGVSATGDTDPAPFTTTVATIEEDTGLLTVSLIVNIPTLSFAGMDGNFPLTEAVTTLGAKTYFELDSMEPGPKLAAAVVVNDKNSGLFGATSSVLGD